MGALSPRFFILPLLALMVIGSLPAPADSGRTRARAGCGPAIASILDPSLRATFERLNHAPSAAAAKVCALYHNNMASVVSR